MCGISYGARVHKETTLRHGGGGGRDTLTKSLHHSTLADLRLTMLSDVMFTVAPRSAVPAAKHSTPLYLVTPHLGSIHLGIARRTKKLQPHMPQNKGNRKLWCAEAALLLPDIPLWKTASDRPLQNPARSRSLEIT